MAELVRRMLDAPAREVAVLALLLFFAVATAVLALVALHLHQADPEFDEVERHQAQMRALAPEGRRR